MSLPMKIFASDHEIVVFEGQESRELSCESMVSGLLDILNGVDISGRHVDIIYAGDRQLSIVSDIPHMSKISEAIDLIKEKEQVESRYITACKLHRKQGDGYVVFILDDAVVEDVHSFVKKTKCILNGIYPVVSITSGPGATIFMLGSSGNRTIVYQSDVGIAHIRQSGFHSYPDGESIEKDDYAIIDHMRRYIEHPKEKVTRIDIASCDATQEFDTSMDFIPDDEKHIIRGRAIRSVALMISIVIMLGLIAFAYGATRRSDIMQADVLSRYSEYGHAKNIESLRDIMVAKRASAFDALKTRNKIVKLDAEIHPPVVAPYLFVSRHAVDGVVLHSLKVSRVRLGGIQWQMSGVIMAPADAALPLLYRYIQGLSTEAIISPGWKNSWLSSVARWEGAGRIGGISFSLKGSLK